MKKRTLNLLSMSVMLYLATTAMAQSGERQMFSYHEDRVHPHKVTEYEAASKNLKMQLEKHSISTADYLAFVTEDLRYTYLAPIDNFAALDRNPFAGLREKMGDEAFGAMWAALDECYDEHGGYIMVLDPELSYQPGGVNPNPEGEHYRIIEYWYASPKNAAALAAKGKEIKASHKQAGSELYYRVYRSGFGTMGPFFMVAIAAKNPQDMQSKMEAAQKKTGDAHRKLLDEAMGLTRKYERVRGWVRPDLSYSPSKK